MINTGRERENFTVYARGHQSYKERTFQVDVTIALKTLKSPAIRKSNRRLVVYECQFQYHSFSSGTIPSDIPRLLLVLCSENTPVCVLGIIYSVRDWTTV